MRRGLIDVLIDALEDRYPRLRTIFPIVAFILLLVIVGFALYALSSLPTRP
jgi:hypothetical protein